MISTAEVDRNFAVYVPNIREASRVKYEIKTIIHVNTTLAK